MGKTTNVTGTIIIATAGPYTYGDSVAFNTMVTGKLGAKSRTYVQVLGSQLGHIVYQWSADASFAFPLVQQDGLAALGMMFDPEQPASFTASLIYREDGGQTIIKTLAQVAFVTDPTP